MYNVVWSSRGGGCFVDIMVVGRGGHNTSQKDNNSE